MLRGTLDGDGAACREGAVIGRRRHRRVSGTDSGHGTVRGDRNDLRVRTVPDHADIGSILRRDCRLDGERAADGLESVLDRSDAQACDRGGDNDIAVGRETAVGRRHENRGLTVADRIDLAVSVNRGYRTVGSAPFEGLVRRVVREYGGRQKRRASLVQPEFRLVELDFFDPDPDSHVTGSRETSVICPRGDFGCPDLKSLKGDAAVLPVSIIDHGTVLHRPDDLLVVRI